VLLLYIVLRYYSNFAAWQEVYERWDVYTQVVKTFTEETVNDSSVRTFISNDSN
jgi:hypothetical protein